MARPSPLDDPVLARNAWARYRRLMRWMALASFVAVVVSLSLLRWTLGEGVTVHMMIATSAGVGGSVLLTAALMGLVFLSSGSGHDDAIEDPFANEQDQL